MRRGITACAVVGGALALAPAAAAANSGGKESATHVDLKRFEVKTDFVDERALRPDGFDCRPSLLRPETFKETCKMHLVGIADLTGTIEGTAQLNYQVWPDPPKLRYTGVVPFEGTVEGCGTGTFVMEFPYGIVHYDKFDPADQSAPGMNTWRVRKGSGEGGLKRLVSGGGDVVFRAYATRGHEPTAGIFPGDFAKGTFDGKVTCAVPSSQRATASGRRRMSSTDTSGGRR